MVHALEDHPIDTDRSLRSNPQVRGKMLVRLGHPAQVSESADQDAVDEFQRRIGQQGSVEPDQRFFVSAQIEQTRAIVSVPLAELGISRAQPKGLLQVRQTLRRSAHEPVRESELRQPVGIIPVERNRLLEMKNSQLKLPI